VRLLASPAGEAPPSSRHSFSSKNLKLLPKSVEVWRDLGPKSPARQAPEEIGSELFRALISGEIQRRWDTNLEQVRQEGKGLRLRLRLGDVPGLEEWPWELLYDPTHQQFLSLFRDTTVVRYLDNPTRPGFEAIQPPIRVLVVIANPVESSAIDGEREWKLLNQALSRLVEDGKVLIERLEPPSLPALEQAMKRPWHVVHFVGHGRFDGEEGRLLLEDGSGRQREVTGKTLRVLLESQEQLRLVVLNACSGAKTSPENAFAGVAQSLVGAGLPAVVAMRCRVSDRAALVFAERFYQALAGELPVDVSLSEARRGMHAGGEDLEWSTPVLYMRSPDGRIFDFMASPTVAGPRWPHRRGLLAAALGTAAAVGGAYWASTFPLRSSDPDCPSPPGLDMALVKIQPGRFAMGKNGTPVEITRPFCLGRFEVTQLQWKKIMGTPPRQKKEGDDFPVGNVSWEDAKAFLARLGSRDFAPLYRLPTEAQWEYAARAGTSNRFSFGEDSLELRHYGNCSKAGEPTPVGSFRKNPWGLYDMYGNVSEWVEDWAGPLPIEPAIDPVGPKTGLQKIRRGGSFDYGTHCDSVFRLGSAPDQRAPGYGFRIVRQPVRPAR
jgi:formylglycine-generating enzyme required for sulfatase activity